jgi:hypothetical protein
MAEVECTALVSAQVDLETGEWVEVIPSFDECSPSAR